MKKMKLGIKIESYTWGLWVLEQDKGSKLSTKACMKGPKSSKGREKKKGAFLMRGRESAWHQLERCGGC